MTITLDHSTPGRGAWSSKGGARSLDGKKAGPFYRSTTNPNLPDIGEDVYRASVSTVSETVHINDYAVWRGAYEIQRELKRQGFYTGNLDGWWGAGTDAAVKAWQEHTSYDVDGNRMLVDGVYGPQTAKTMWQPRLLNAVSLKGDTFVFMPSQRNITMLNDYAKATVQLESGWDIAAVGATTPYDLGPSQINTKAHKVSPQQAFDPNYAFGFKMNIVVENFNYGMGDLAISMCSYNVGRGGAWNWHKAGRPGDWAAANYLRALRPYLTVPELIDATDV